MQSFEGTTSSLIRFYCAFLAFLLFFTAAIDIQYGLDDLRMVDAFEVDEAHVLSIVSENLKNADFDPRGYYHYPYFWFSTGIVPLRFFQNFGYRVDIRFIAACFRLISLLGAVACLILFLKLLLVLQAKSSLAYIGGLYLVTTPEFYYWSHIVHPDVPQTSLIIAAFLISFSDHTFRGSLASALVNGLAFATKFAGIFSFPFCQFYHVLSWLFATPELDNTKGKRATPATIAKRFLLCCLVFAAVFLATNPYVVLNFTQLVEGVSFIKRTIGAPYSQPRPWEPWAWVNIFFQHGGAFFKAVLLVGGSAFLVSLCHKCLRFRQDGFLCDRHNLQCVVILLYIIFNILILTFLVRWLNLRYAFHVLPMVILVAFIGIDRVVSRLPSTLRVFIVVLLAASLVPRVAQSLERMRFANHKPVSDTVKVAEFIEQTYHKDTVIFFESGAYVPNYFPNSQGGAGISEAVFSNLNPEVIVLHLDMSGRWIWKAENTSFAEGKFVGDPNASERAQQAYRIFKRLISPASDWKVVLEQGPCIVLARRQQVRGKRQRFGPMKNKHRSF